MSNKFKIKNIWTPEVSREEYAKSLAEWDKALSSLDARITLNTNNIATLISDNGVVIQKSDNIVLETDNIFLTANNQSWFSPIIGSVDLFKRKQALALEIYFNGSLENEVLTFTSDNIYQPHYFPNTNFWIAYARGGNYIYVKTNKTGTYKLVFKLLRI